ncbi:hypothetical protein QP185_03205 [Sphingomonas aerolata]|uniref:hypothetical protein n=1 Tax=Sphingomonas aerolata TaxID=185951 RepID=UPI002FE35FA9
MPAKRQVGDFVARRHLGPREFAIDEARSDLLAQYPDSDEQGEQDECYDQHDPLNPREPAATAGRRVTARVGPYLARLRQPLTPSRFPGLHRR